MEYVFSHSLIRIVIWFMAEIFLNLIGLDDLADFGEWVFERHGVVHIERDAAWDYLEPQLTVF